jgi:hypothetical protein
MEYGTLPGQTIIFTDLWSESNIPTGRKKFSFSATKVPSSEKLFFSIFLLVGSLQYWVLGNGVTIHTLFCNKTLANFFAIF